MRKVIQKAAVKENPAVADIQTVAMMMTMAGMMTVAMMMTMAGMMMAVTTTATMPAVNADRNIWVEKKSAAVQPMAMAAHWKNASSA